MIISNDSNLPSINESVLQFLLSSNLNIILQYLRITWLIHANSL